MKDDKLNEYARLVIKVGVNLHRGQPLVINSPIEFLPADFARRIAREAYKAGASDVTMSWSDEKSALIRYMMADDAAFDTFPAWRKTLYDDAAAAGAAVVSIHAENPDIFKSVNPKRLKASQQSAGMALKDYRARLMSNKNTWCVVSVPTPDWAMKVFPKLKPGDAIACLWDAIMASVRVSGDGNAIENWHEHITFLSRAARFLNRAQFASLHYTNELGTNLTIRLPDGHVWAGGAEDAEDGTPFAANIPTEEVYTLPHRDGVDGVAVASRPLVYGGNTIEGMRLTFERGKVVKYDAYKGKDVLKELLENDEGATHLGEVALVPYDSPIQKSGILFYNTLFDENAACHLALGKAYPTCLEGSASMTDDELLAHGVNDSLVHEDFMVGSRELNIDGTTKDGKTMPVFRHGNFVDFG
ncbi:MAG: aminopeptidase [Selenomonadaceae bacterium]